MRLIIAILIFVFIFCSLYWGIIFYQKVQVGRGLVENAIPFQNITEDLSRSLLVLGDSTGVGVGASKPEDSVAGHLAREMKATYTENNAVSGAQVADLSGQVAKATQPYYDTVLIHIGGNDIIRFHSVRSVSAELARILDSLADRSERVIVLSAGDIGTTTLFPPILRPLYTRLTLHYHAAFTEIAKEHGATYINLYTAPENDLFIKEPDVYFASDGLHLTSAGCALWYTRLQETVTP